MLFFYFSRLSPANWLLSWHLFCRGYEKRGQCRCLSLGFCPFDYCDLLIVLKELRVFKSFGANYFHICSSEEQMDVKTKFND